VAPAIGAAIVTKRDERRRQQVDALPVARRWQPRSAVQLRSIEIALRDLA
jgi:hypothetical protein